MSAIILHDFPFFCHSISVWFPYDFPVVIIIIVPPIIPLLLSYCAPINSLSFPNWFPIISISFSHYFPIFTWSFPVISLFFPQYCHKIWYIVPHYSPIVFVACPPYFHHSVRLSSLWFPYYCLYYLLCFPLFHYFPYFFPNIIVLLFTHVFSIFLYCECVLPVSWTC